MIRVEGPSSPYDPTYHLLTRFHKIREIVARERPDVLEIHSPYLAAAGALRASPGTYGIRTFQWHSDFIDTYAGVLGRRLDEAAAPLGTAAPRPSRAVSRLTQPLWSLVRAIGTRCDATLVASRWQQEKLEAHGVPRVRLRPFGIERETFRARAPSEDVRRDLIGRAGRRDATRPPPAIVLGIGRFAVEKRWDVVIDAFARVRRTRDAILVLVGDGPERARMLARASALGVAADVVHPGFLKDREELAALLASADALLHGCPYETFGLSIAEALAVGLPVVVPDEGGAAEMYEADYGERYRAGDAADAADALGRMLDRLAIDAPRLRAKASARARQLPDVREQFEHQIALYEELLARTSWRRPG